MLPTHRRYRVARVRFTVDVVTRSFAASTSPLSELGALWSPVGKVDNVEIKMITYAGTMGTDERALCTLCTRCRRPTTPPTKRGI